MKQEKNRTVFLPLGGSGEIGMNMNLFGYGQPNKEKWIMVDCGITFGDAQTPGVEVIFPNYDFIKERKKDLLAIILTHAHEDHIGAIAHVFPNLTVPIYATPFTSRTVIDKMNDLGVNYEGMLHTIPLKAKLSFGDFGVEFVSITHSIPEPNGLYITTPNAKIYHTGDWKFDENPVLGDATDYKRIEEIAKLGVDACICDSTNALDKGRSGSESDILTPMTKAIESCSGRVAITTFASNVARMKTLIMASVAAGRDYILCGRSMERIFNHGREMGYFDGFPAPKSLEELPNIPDNKIVCICTGSQGEERAALGKMARDVFPFFKLHAGDTVIFSSKAIPGNEKSIYKIFNQLAHKNINVITSKELDIHVSGHPCAEELRDLYKTLRPTSCIPVHGEQRHMMRHAEIAHETGVKHSFIPQNGDMIEINSINVTHVDRIKAGRIYVDGRIHEDWHLGSSQKRFRLSYAGYTSISLIMDKQSNLLTEPVIQSFGVPELNTLFKSAGEKPLLNALKQAYMELPIADYADDSKIEQAIRQAYRKFINSIWGKKPITDVKLIRIGEERPSFDMRRVLSEIPVGKKKKKKKKSS